MHHKASESTGFSHQCVWYALTNTLTCRVYKTYIYRKSEAEGPLPVVFGIIFWQVKILMVRICYGSPNFLRSTHKQIFSREKPYGLRQGIFLKLKRIEWRAIRKNWTGRIAEELKPKPFVRNITNSLDQL